MNLIILTPRDALSPMRYRLAGNRAEHIRSVLRLKPGDTLEAGVLDGPQGTARIEEITGSEVTLACEDLRCVPPPLPAIDLICALPRPQTLKKVLLTSAMMGVRRLHLIRANRVEKSYFHTPLLEPEKYEPHLIEGLSQGKLTRIPRVHVHQRFRTFFEDTLPAFDEAESCPAARLLPHPDFDAALDVAYDGAPERFLLAIGPEGGWVPFEIELMEGLGFRGFTLGRWVLRVETAVAAALAQMELVRMRTA